MKDQDLNTIRDLIAYNHIDVGITLLMSVVKDHKDNSNELTIIRANNNDLYKKIEFGILNAEQERIERNRIIYQLLKMIDNIEIDYRQTTEAEIESEMKFNSTITLYMQELNRVVEKLTEEQFRVIRMLRSIKKVRISGCAGSGKTLIAVEKSIRLSKAGVKTLFLCHNPFLAEYIKNLVIGEDIEVFSFNNWVNSINNLSLDENIQWSILDEPTRKELSEASENIEKYRISYDAIIVDEGQDFRGEWWELVESGLDSSGMNILYIFHDDNQILLPHRGEYPFEDPVLDLSRNCRNGGKIFDFMKSCFHHRAPEISKELENLGEIRVLKYSDSQSFKNQLYNAINWFYTFKDIEQVVILLAGTNQSKDWELDNLALKLPKGTGWIGEVYQQFKHAVESLGIEKYNWSEKIRGFRIKTSDVRERSLWLKKTFSDLKLNDPPTTSDIKKITDLSQIIENEFKIDKNRKLNFSAKFKWKSIDGKMKLETTENFHQLWYVEFFRFFSTEKWADGLFHEKRIKFGTELCFRKSYYPVLDVSSYKGLESDGVILISKEKNLNFFNELYVGVTRAKGVLALLTDDTFNTPINQWIHNSNH